MAKYCIPIGSYERGDNIWSDVDILLIGNF